MTVSTAIAVDHPIKVLEEPVNGLTFCILHFIAAKFRLEKVFAFCILLKQNFVCPIRFCFREVKIE